MKSYSAIANKFSLLVPTYIPQKKGKQRSILPEKILIETNGIQKRFIVFISDKNTSETFTVECGYSFLTELPEFRNDHIKISNYAPDSFGSRLNWMCYGKDHFWSIQKMASGEYDDEHLGQVAKMIFDDFKRVAVPQFDLALKIRTGVL